MNKYQQTYYTDPRAQIFATDKKNSNKPIEGSCTTTHRQAKSQVASKSRFGESNADYSSDVMTMPAPKCKIKCLDRRELRATNNKKRFFWYRFDRRNDVSAANDKEEEEGMVDRQRSDKMSARCVGVQVGLPTCMLVRDIRVGSLLPHKTDRPYDSQRRYIKEGVYLNCQPMPRRPRTFISKWVSTVGTPSIDVINEVRNEGVSHRDDVPSEDNYDGDVIDEVSETLLAEGSPQHPAVLAIRYADPFSIPRPNTVIGTSHLLQRPHTHYDGVALKNWPNEQVLTDLERSRLSQFYKCMGSSIYVARSPAVVFRNKADATSKLQEWERLYVGVPVWVFNCGLFPGKPRKLQLIVAEKGSGFMLLDSTVDWRSDVQQPKSGFLTLHAKGQDTIVALRFLSEIASLQFYENFLKISEDVSNIDIFEPAPQPGEKGGGHVVSRATPSCRCVVQRISKKSISSPTEFKHINSLRGSNSSSFYSLRALV